MWSTWWWMLRFCCHPLELLWQASTLWRGSLVVTWKRHAGWGHANTMIIRSAVNWIFLQWIMQVWTALHLLWVGSTFTLMAADSTFGVQVNFTVFPYLQIVWFSEMFPIKTVSPTVDDGVIFGVWGRFDEILIIICADKAQDLSFRRTCFCFCFALFLCDLSSLPLGDPCLLHVAIAVPSAPGRTWDSAAAHQNRRPYQDWRRFRS